MALASDAKPDPLQPMTGAQWSLLLSGGAIVSAYIAVVVLDGFDKTGKWHSLLPAVLMFVGNGALIAGGLIDMWPTRPLEIAASKWRRRLFGRLLVLGVSAGVALPMLVLVELFVVQIVRVLLHR